MIFLRSFYLHVLLNFKDNLLTTFSYFFFVLFGKLDADQTLLCFVSRGNRIIEQSNQNNNKVFQLFVIVFQFVSQILNV